MWDETASTSAIDERVDHILSGLGLKPDGPAEQFTYFAGRAFGERFGELLPIDQALLDSMVREALEEFESIFPTNPDAETLEFQAYLLGPLVSLFLAGRGLTIPEIAILAGVTRAHAYRLNRVGLSIIYAEKESTPHVGVNRRYSGRDDRESHRVIDLDRLGLKPWPEPIEPIRPFLLGMMDGLKAALARPEVRDQIEPKMLAAFGNLLSDSAVGDVIDGMILALDRIAQGLRDTAPGQSGPILRMQSDREKAVAFQGMLAELKARRDGIVRVLAYTGSCMEIGRQPDKAKIEALLDSGVHAA